MYVYTQCPAYIFSYTICTFFHFALNLFNLMLYLKDVTACNLAKKLNPLFYYLILLFQLSVANPENFEEFKVREVLKIRKEKTGISPTSLVR